jgi:hypothetical protein
VFGARLGTASRRSQSSMKSARVGSLGSWSGSVSRARHASTNSRTPGQPPASLASSKSRSQRRALSMRLNVSRPARSSPSSSGFQRKRTTCGGPGSPPSVRVECSEAISLGTQTDGKLPTYSGLQIAVAHAALRSSSDKRGGALLRSRPAEGLTGRLDVGPTGCVLTGLRGRAEPRAVASRDCFGAARGALAQRRSSDVQTMTRPPATRCTTASSPDAYARRIVLIDGQAFERSAAASPRRAARA